MLDWNELKEPRHREMLDDVKRMLALRRREANVLTPQVRGDIEPQLVAVPYKADINVPVPYMRWKDSTAVVVMANRYVDADAHLKLNLPIEKMGAPSAARYKVTDLWRGKKPRVYAATALARLSYTVKRDKTPQGGIGLLKIEPVQ
jgi:hypothetical protein